MYASGLNGNFHNASASSSAMVAKSALALQAGTSFAVEKQQLEAPLEQSTNLMISSNFCIQIIHHSNKLSVSTDMGSTVHAA